MKVAVVDDVADASASVKSLLDLYAPGTETVGFSGGAEYLDYVKSTDDRFDVMFLDIVLTDQLGINYADQFFKDNPELILVFMSTDSIWFREVYRVPHCYFLTKPIEALYFRDCLKRIGEELSARKLLLHVGAEEKVISLKDITYIESMMRKAIFHFVDGSTLSIYQRIDTIEASLPPQSFVRVHKSFLVNLANMEKFERNRVLFPDGSFVNISRSYLQNFRERSTAYFAGLL